MHTLREAVVPAEPMSSLGVADGTERPDGVSLSLVDDIAIQLEDVTKVFGEGESRTVALDGLSLEVKRGELVCLLGASGCGKSTVLNLAAGLDSPTSGRVAVPSGTTALMFQEAALFPWLTVEKNVGMPMRLRGRSRRERADEIRELLSLVRLDRFARHRPHQLSGGMRQRVALACALAQHSEVLLMDEPFGAVDAITRDLLHEDLLRVRNETHVTMLFVTHSVREATRLGDRIVVLSSRPGRVLEEFTIGGDGSPSDHEQAAASLVPRITEVLRKEIARHSHD